MIEWSYMHRENFINIYFDIIKLLHSFIEKLFLLNLFLHTLFRKARMDEKGTPEI